MIYCSLKENTYYESAVNVLDYRIVDEQSNIVYYGHSIKNPKTGINRINITEIIRDWLHSNLEDNWETLSNESGYTCQQEDAYKEFSIINGELLLEKYAVLYDYEDIFTGGDIILSDPINGRLDPRMKFFYSYAGLSGATIEIDGEQPVPPPSPYEQQYFTYEALSSGTINLTFEDYSSVATPLLVSYRKNSSDWNTGYFGSTSIPVDSGDIVEFKGNNSAYRWGVTSGTSTRYVFNIFTTSAKCNIYGNIMSIVYGDNFIGNTGISANAFYSLIRGNVISAEHLVLPSTALEDDCYAYMFSNCSSLTTAPALPATTLAEGCYQSMFRGCTSLVNAPELPATTLEINCYKDMFSNCSSLTTAPALPATTLAAGCYQYMFTSCFSLVNAPDLPATTLAGSCYDYMFAICYSLVNAPALPATTLADYCYKDMFYACTSLVNAPALPATTLAKYCYDDMFNRCTSLTTAPDLPATTLAQCCYQQMFYNCSALNYVKCLALTFDNDSTDIWLSGVSQTGTFVKKQGATWETGASGIPNNWTVEEEV